MASNSANIGYILAGSNVPPVPLMYITDNTYDGCYPLYGSNKGLPTTLNINSELDTVIIMPGYYVVGYNKLNYDDTDIVLTKDTTSAVALTIWPKPFGTSNASYKIYKNNNSTNEIKNSLS